MKISRKICSREVTLKRIYFTTRPDRNEQGLLSDARTSVA